MKLIVFLIFTAVVAKIVYWLNRKDKKRAVTLTAITVLILVFLQAFVIYRGATAPDKWCTTFHTTNSYPPTALKTAMDYFEQGNYDYDTGNCKAAIEDYTKSIKLNSGYPQAYNNRAYTNMRLRNYKDALPDLDKAISLNPNYINALMNRADIHNSYFETNYQKATADYEKVISLGGSPNACTRLLSAKHNGADFRLIFIDPIGLFKCIREK